MRCDVMADRIGQQLVPSAETIERRAYLLPDFSGTDINLYSGQKVERGRFTRSVAKRKDA